METEFFNQEWIQMNAKYKIVFSGLLLLLTITIGVAVRSVLQREEPKGQQSIDKITTASVLEMADKVDESVLEAALKMPETFHQTEPDKTESLEQKLTKYADLSSRPALMSERQSNIQERDRVADVNTNTPKFMDSFALLRKEEVRNPDSEQNRAAVTSLMKKRQNRVGQLEKKVKL